MSAAHKPCMGGWCPRRERCARYWQPSLLAPAERLCEPGLANAYKPIGGDITNGPAPPPLEPLPNRAGA